MSAISPSDTDRASVADLLYGELRQAYAASPRSPFVVGLCGAQGSGKSTLAAKLADRLGRDFVPTVVVSLDDIYLTRSERIKLAKDVHPLLATRGVPGTHDVELGIGLLDTIGKGRPVRVPRFDKLSDDRCDESRWDVAPADTRIVIFEGWCVGAKAQRADELAAPVNMLEASQDPHAMWRTFINEALAGRYQSLFERVDFLTLLAAPGFECVEGWRWEQECALACTAANDQRRAMSRSEVSVFVQHYERITRHILSEMPQRADATINLSANRALDAPGSRGAVTEWRGAGRGC